MEYRGQGVRVGQSPSGLGVFSLRPFVERERIGPIRGTVICDPWYESDYCMELGDHSALEPDPPFRYINHSCHPNCSLVVPERNKAGGPLLSPVLWLEAISPIGLGEQLTIDYAWPARDAIPCDCGCPDCRGWIVSREESGQLASALPRLYSLRRAPARHRRHLGRLYRLWQRWNRRFFANRLSLPLIRLSRFGGAGTCGSCGPARRQGARSRIQIQLSLLLGTHRRAKPGKTRVRSIRSRYRLMAEVLLHEMVHQWQQEVAAGDGRDWRNHGSAFCEKCNEIGRQLRLRPVRAAGDPADGDAPPSCSHWPHSARGAARPRPAGPPFKL